MGQSNRVLCVLSNAQREEYEAELAQLRQPGVDVIFEGEAEKAVSLIDRVDPTLVILGTQIEDYEGIELMTMIMQQHKSFHRPIVILPEKEDGLAPMLHSRSLATGQSSVEATGFDLIAELVTRPPEEVPVLGEFPGPAAAGVPKLKQMPESEDAISPSQILKPALSGLEAKIPTTTAQPATPGLKGRAKLIGAIAAVAVVIVIGLVVMLSGGDKGSDTPQVAEAAVVKAPARVPEAPIPEPETVTQSPEAEPAQTPEKAVDEPAEPADEKQEPPKAEEEPPEAEEEPPPEIDPSDLLVALTFDQGQGNPTVVDQGKMDDLVEALKQTPKARIVLTGHTSSEGEASDNYDLALKRAKRVREILVRAGIPKRRIQTRSKGEKEPIVPNDNEAQRAKNRRVELEIVR